MPDDQPPASEFPSLDEVQSSLQQAGADPVKSAEVIRNWRTEAVTQLDSAFPDAVDRNRAADRVDEVVSGALKQQQGQAFDAWAADRFGGDQAQASKFLGSYDQANGDPQKMPVEYQGLATEVSKITSADLFKPTYEARNATGSIMAGPTKIGAFTSREIPHKGVIEAQVTPIVHGEAQPDIATAPKLSVKVPIPTADDLKSEAEKATAEADRLDNEIQGAQASEYVVSTRELDQKAQEMRDRAKRLLSPGGKDMLATERIQETLKGPDYKEKLGRLAGWEGFTNGLDNAKFAVGNLMARAHDLTYGGDRAARLMSEAKTAQEVANPGSTRTTFSGSFADRQIQSLQTMSGEMLPYMAGAGAARLAVAGGERLGISALAREAAAGAANPSGVGAAGAGMGVGATGSAYGETQRQIEEAVAAGDTVRADELRNGRDAHAILTGLVMGGFSKFSPLHNLRASGSGAASWAADIAKQSVEMPAMTTAQGLVVDPIIGNHPDVAGELPGAMVQGAGMALIMGGLTQIGQNMFKAKGEVAANRQKSLDLAANSGAGPATIQAIHEIHDQQDTMVEQQAKADAKAHIDQIKATAAQMDFHNKAVENIRSATREGLIPTEEPPPPDAPKEVQQLYDIREKEAAHKALEIQLMDIERDSTLSADDRAKLREPLIKERAKGAAELMKLNKSLPEYHAALNESAPPEPTSDSTPSTQEPPQSSPAPAQPPEPAVASDQSPPAPVATASSSGQPNIREPWVNDALKLAGQGKDQRGPLSNALKAMTPEERSAAAERAGVKSPTIDDHILLAREMSDAAGKPPPAEPGRPQVSESPWGPNETTGVKNETIDNERAAMGLTPLASSAAREWGPLWDQAGEALANNPQAGYERTAALHEPGSQHSDADVALLLRHKIELEHAAQLAAREINSEHTTDTARENAVARRAAALKSLVDVHEVLRRTGSEAGRSLNARRMMMDRNEVPTVAEMEADRRIEKGRELSADERDEVNRIHTEMTDAKVEVDAADDATARSAATTEMQKVAEDIAASIEPPQEKPEPSQKVKDAEAKREQRRIAGEAAKQRIREKLGLRLNVGIDPTVLADMAIYGHYIIGEGLTKLSEFTAHMVEQFGEVVRKDIPAIFKSANAMSLDADKALALASKKAQKAAGESPVAIVESAAKGVKPGDPVDPSVARKLLEAHIREGVRGTDDLTHRMQTSLSDVYGRDVTDREVWDAITGYGKVSKPSQDAVQKLARAYSTEALLRRKLSAAQAKEAVLKTGSQRDRQTEEVRRLQRELNEEMRKNGYSATSEGQVRGRLDAIKQGLKNQIEDLESVIEGRQKLKPKGMPVELDPETRALKEQLKTLKEHLAGIPEFKAQLDAAENTRAIEAAKASRDEYNRRIREKEFESQGKKDKVVTAELRRMRAERDLAGKNYRDAMAASDQGKARDIQNKIDTATKQVEAKEQELIDAKWTATQPKGTKLSDNPELKLIQQRSVELTKELQIQRHGDGMEAFTKWFDKRLQNLRDSLAGIEAAKPPGRIVPDNAETKAMKVEIKDLERLQREKRQPERDLKAMEDRTDKMKRQIDNPDYSVKPKDAKVLSPEMKSRQEYLDLLEQIHDNMQERDGSRANEAYRKRLEARMAKMDADVAAGFPDKAPKKLFQPNERSLAAQKAFDKAKAAYENLKAQDALSKRTAYRRWMDRLLWIRRETALANLMNAGQKLGGAGIENILTKPVFDAAAQLFRVTSQLDAIRAKAVYEGGFSWKANVKGLERMRLHAKSVFEKVWKGKSSLDWGRDAHVDPELISYMGRVHGAIKEPVRQFIYGKSMELRFQEAAKRGVDLNTDKAAWQMADSGAFEDAMGDIFMGDNVLTSFFRSGVTAIRKSSKFPGAGNVVADFMELMLPIVTVPTNLMIRAQRLNPLIGLGESFARIARAHSRGELENGAATLSHREAEVIMRAFKYGMVGTALSWYAWTHAKQFGGVYTNTGDKPNHKHDDDFFDPSLQPGDIKVVPGQSWMNHNHLVTHGPVGTYMNYTADARRIYEQEKKKGRSEISAMTTAEAFLLMAPVSRLPYVDSMVRMFNPFKTAGQAMGETTKNVVLGATEPMFADKDENGNPVRRNPKTFLEELMMMVPSMRKEVKPSKHQPKAH